VIRFFPNRVESGDGWESKRAVEFGQTGKSQKAAEINNSCRGAAVGKIEHIAEHWK
jgi:hypothetical protein